MITEISELNTHPSAFDGKDVTVTGSVRAIYHTPFPHFILEDNSGAILCRPENSLPGIGGHLEITGRFAIEIPESLELSVPVLTENKRFYPVHQREACPLAACEFAQQSEFERIWI